MAKKVTKIKLLTGPNCHLCEQAKSVLYPLITERQIDLEEINVRDNKQLFERYGLQIPVILFADGSEKSWPFTAAQIARLMDQQP